MLNNSVDDMCVVYFGGVRYSMLTKEAAMGYKPRELRGRKQSSMKRKSRRP